MSMTILTILQICAVFTAYMTAACVLPFVIINRLLKDLRLSEKFLFSLVFGNFYIINEVFVLELLHIANRFTLFWGYAAVFAAAVIRIYQIPVKKNVRSAAYTLMKLLRGELGVKSLVLRGCNRLLGRLARSFRRIRKTVFRRLPEILCFLGTSALVLWIYLPNLLKNYGYCASDVPVHNYWINALGQGKLFVAGVYPFGFHCAIYFLHAVFGIETFVLLRVFCLIQTLFVHWTLLFFLLACLRSGYLAYLGTAVYAAGKLFQWNTYYRFGSSLPQEFGMIFILPAVYFGFAFFQTRKKRWLAGFAMSFSLTLAVHFYGTMIAGLFCVAMALGFLCRFLKRAYFFPVAATCLISVGIAVAPMAIAYASGTPLQGSLGWGLNVISAGGTSSDEADTETDQSAEEAAAETEDQTAEEAAAETEDQTAEEAAAETADQTAEEAAAETAGQTETTAEVTSAGARGIHLPAKIIAVFGALKQKAQTTAATIGKSLEENIFVYDNPYARGSVFGSIIACFLLALIYLLLRETDEAGRLFTVGWFMIFMSLLLAAGALGIPKLMDSARSSIYYAYMLPVLWGFALDGILMLPGRLLHRRQVCRAAAFVLCIAAVSVLVEKDMVKACYVYEAYETNAAVTCLTNIIHEHEDWTWTICSANDELRMGEDYGYHYETITFLREIEYIGRNAGVKIPTKYTYFFVEKIPLDYSNPYYGSGQQISEEGAMQALPTGGGISAYKQENRWIVMSRMYYWCEAFMQLYPENMTVYYESDDFICYQLEQNVDHLFELGIDYGYNTFWQ